MSGRHPLLLMLVPISLIGSGLLTACGGKGGNGHADADDAQDGYDVADGLDGDDPSDALPDDSSDPAADEEPDVPLTEEGICAPAAVDGEHCYFIDPVSGDDVTGDGSMDAPYRTLGMVFQVNGTIPPLRLDWIDGPKTVVLREGTFEECTPSADQDCVRVAGMKDLVIKSFPGEHPRITAGNEEGDALIVLNVADWDGGNTYNVVVDGLEVEGGYSYTLKLSDAVRDVTVRRCTIHGSAMDVVAVKGRPNGVGVTDPMLRDCVIEGCEIFHGPGAGTRGGEVHEGIDAMAAGTLTIRNNYIHDITGTGLYLKGNCRDGLVESNYIIHTGTGNTQESEQNHDSWCGLWLSGGVMGGFLPSDAPYENMRSVARNNIIVDCQGANAFRGAGTSGIQYVNNTLYNDNRVVQNGDGTLPNWTARLGSGFTQLTDSSPDCASYFPANMGRCPNTDTTFSSNVIIDSLEQTYGTYVPPLVKIYGATDMDIWESGATRDNYHASRNVYFRRDGDYSFENHDVTDYLDTDSLSEFQSVVGVEDESIIATDAVLVIQTGVGPHPEDPLSYIVVSGSEAEILGAGATIDFTIPPWTRWFP